jgi:hypothetical protein
LRYIIDDNSFETEPHGIADITVEYAYLQLGFDSVTMNATNIWGYSPKKSWKRKRFRVPTRSRGKLHLLRKDLSSGVTVGDGNSDTWKNYYDAMSGWICLGDKDFATTIQNSVEFLPNTVATLNERGELVALWLKPRFDNILGENGIPIRE